MDWFKNIKTKEETRSKYRELSKKFHPDAGNMPDGELFIEINEQYKIHLKYLENPRQNRAKPKPAQEKAQKTPPKPPPVDVVEVIRHEPRFTPKQKKHLVKGASLLFDVFASKLIDRIN